ncbi:MAG: nitrophenyl compound nitroreductase subunit ArsF family protein [Desulfobacterales bacterium]
MKMKTVIPIFLVLAFCMVFAASAEEAKDSAASLKSDNSVIVNYFHGKRRCITCQKLEAYAKESLNTYFADELADKRIHWKVTDVSIPENAHFIQDFSLVSQSLVLTMQENGKQTKWQHLDQIWNLVRNQQAYMEYVRDSVKAFMSDNNG